MNLSKLLIALAFFPVCSVQAQTLKLNLSKGTKYEVISTTKVTSIASLMGQEMESGSDINTTELINVNDSRGGETDLTNTITKITASIQGMGQETSYDSDIKDNTGPGTEVFEKMKGKVKNITIDAKGKIIKEDKDEEESAAVSLMGISGNGVSFLGVPFVGREMKPGTTWYDSSTKATLKMTTFTGGDYTVQSVNAGTATLLFKGTTTVSGTMEQMGQEMAMTSSSKVTAQIEVDVTTGVIKKNTTTTDGTMNVEAAGMSIPVTVKTTATISTRQL